MTEGERVDVETYITHTLAVLDSAAPAHLAAFARQAFAAAYPSAYAASEIDAAASALLDRLLGLGIEDIQRSDLLRGVDMARIGAIERRVDTRLDHVREAAKLEAVRRLILRRRAMLDRSARGATRD